MDVLVSRYHGRLLDFAPRHLRDRDCAADIAQNALVKVFEGAAWYRGQASFRTWLYTIALNLVRDEFRGRRVGRESLTCEIGDIPPGLYVIRVEAEGFEAESRLVELPPGREVNLLPAPVSASRGHPSSTASPAPKGRSRRGAFGPETTL